jgi:hypothetical protein
MTFTRRQFGRLALAAIPAGFVARGAAQTAAKPNSVVRGVGIGMNMPYNLGGRNASIDDLVNSCTVLGVSVMELRSQPIETFLGAPDRLMPLSQPRRAGGATAEQLARAEADAKAAMPELEKWRLGVSLDRLAELRDGGLYPACDVSEEYSRVGVCMIQLIPHDGAFLRADELGDEGRFPAACIRCDQRHRGLQVRF